MRAVLSALAHAHGHGVLHGNLGIDHVCLSPGGTVRLRGFGSECIFNTSVECVPPEGVQDGKADSWAAGIIMFQALCKVLSNEASQTSVARTKLFFGDVLGCDRSVIDVRRIIEHDHRLFSLPPLVKVLLAGLLDVDVERRLSVAEGLRICERALKVVRHDGRR